MFDNHNKLVNNYRPTITQNVNVLPLSQTDPVDKYSEKL
jgi:hypothetical protein